MLSHDDLAERAGVHPWQLHGDLADGDPGEISQMASGAHRRCGAALPITPRLEEQSSGLQPCDDPSDQGPLGRISVAKRYWLRDLPAERTTEMFDAVESHWLSHDYRVLDDKRDRSAPALFVENNTDAFRMSLKTSVQGDLSISATSPCVWPDGAPPS